MLSERLRYVKEFTNEEEERVWLLVDESENHARRRCGMVDRADRIEARLHLYRKRDGEEDRPVLPRLPDRRRVLWG